LISRRIGISLTLPTGLGILRYYCCHEQEMNAV
jgi:hypothetical protein